MFVCRVSTFRLLKSGHYSFSCCYVLKIVSATEEEREECKAKLSLVPKCCLCVSTQEKEHIEIEEVVNI